MTRLRFLALCAAAGCSPQWTITVTTNAPVPGWGDRVRIELLHEDGSPACGDCARELAVTAADFPITFGVAHPDGDGTFWVRGRLYRASQVGSDGLPPSTDLIDELGVLPDQSSSGGVLLLEALCFGRPALLSGPGAPQSCNLTGMGVGLSAPAPLIDLSIDDSSLPGGIDKLLPTDCRVSEAGMACVPSVAFLLGSARSLGVDTDYPPLPEIAMQEAYPILMDVDEVTVRTVRDLIDAGTINPGPDDLWSPGTNPESGHCTFLDDGSNDALPVNCISQLAAEEACMALGKLLPQEDQWELAASNGAADTTYPWGQAPPGCGTAIVSADPSCVRSDPVAGGSPNDVNQAGIRNLGGNLSEWVWGGFYPYTDDCWRPNGTLYDGACADILWSGASPHRGGSFDRRATSAASFARFASPDGGPSPSIGFRCVKGGI